MTLRFAFLLWCLSSVGLLAVSCGNGAREYAGDEAFGGDTFSTSGTSSTAAGSGGSATSGGSGSVSSGGSGGSSSGGGDAEGTSGAGGSGDRTCTEEEKLCAGACVEIDDPAFGCDATQCDTDSCPDIPGATLKCEDGQCVLSECGDGSKQCGGGCVPVDDPAYGCGADTCDASACPSQGTGATLACEGEACVIDTCPEGYKKCGDKCVAVSDPTYGCGLDTCDASGCPAAGNGTLVCQGTSCVIGTCGAGTKKCGDKCVTTDANNGCQQADRCTACANNEACSGTPSKCECVPIPKATACAGKDCGTVSNGCGGTHNCGSCTSPQTCGGSGTANVCGCTPTSMSTACQGKNCGTVPNGCGGTHNCGSCTSPQTCGGAGTASVCGCTPSAKSTACQGKSCGTVSNGCGGTHTCGSCSSSTPICVSNACQECSTVNDCPSGTFNCTNNKCVCRVPSSANAIKDGGFDTASTLSAWSVTDASWQSGDADNCPASGSVKIIGSIRRCIQIPTVTTPNASLALGLRFKATESGMGCLGLLYADAKCTQNAGTPNFLNMSAGGSSAWASAFASVPVPEGTSSVLLECKGYTSGLTIDQIYLRLAGGTGGF